VKFSPTSRRIAMVLIVVFILTTIWAAYSLYAESRSAPPSPTTVATYSEGSVNSFVAALAPSYLYNNSTEITGGNTTLFTPITHWINASIAYSLEINRTARISLVEAFTVTLSTPVWSKTLFTASNNSSFPATTTTTFAIRYAINVSSIVALAEAIDAQLDYTGNGYTLSLDPAITGLIEVGGLEQSIALEPRLNFTFLESLVTPSGLSYSAGGSLLSLSPVGNSDGPATLVPSLGLVGSGVGLCAGAWIATRRDEDAPTLPLDQIVRPYEEAIAVIAQAPKDTTPTPVATFPDLVKIADTLGKPILRPAGPDPARRNFFVLDGSVAYTYQHPPDVGTRTTPENGPRPAPGIRRPPTPPGIVEQLKQQVTRLDGLSLDAATASEARRRVRRAVELIHAGKEREAAEEVVELSQLPTGTSVRPP
jgi:hypothetical protein